MTIRYLVLLLLHLSLAQGLRAESFAFLESSQTNVIYGMDHGAALLMDVYESEKPNGYALIFIMGTGFTAYGGYDDLPLKQLDRWLLEVGVLQNYMGENRQLFAPAVEAGFTVFSLNHRLSPRNQWETQLRDVQRAIQYVRANAEQFGVNSDWIAGMGHSSGASLIALAGLSEDVADPSHLDRIARVSSRMQAIVPVSGLHDLLAALEEVPSIGPMLAGYTGRVISYQPPGHAIYETYRQASPVTHVDPSDPPMFLIHGVDDPVVSLHQSEALAAALQAAGVAHELLLVPNCTHGQILEETEDLPMDSATQWLLQQLPESEGG
jgi:acetyl esterase/lipase